MISSWCHTSLTLHFWHQGSWVSSPKNFAGVFGSLPSRIWILLIIGRRNNCGRGLKHTPLATFEYAWLHRRLQRNIQRSKKNSLTEDFEDVQGNEIAALDAGVIRVPTASHWVVHLTQASSTDSGVRAALWLLHLSLVAGQSNLNMIFYYQVGR